MARVISYLFLAVVLIESSTPTLEEDINEAMNNSNGTDRSLSRRRRYLVFPSGSSFQLVYCLTVPSVGMGQIFTLGHTAALAWELPDKPEFLLDLKDKKHHTTTEAPETTTLPHLHLDHDYDNGYQHDNGQGHDHGYDNGHGNGYDNGYSHDYDSSHHYAPPPMERLDKPPKYSLNRWSPQRVKPSGAVNNRKTYYNPFFIRKPSPVAFGYSSIKSLSNQGANGPLQKNSITGSGSRRKVTYVGGGRPKTSKYSSDNYYQQSKPKKPVTTYIHPVFHQHYRRTRRDLYGKIESLFTALSKDGKNCLLKAVCQVSQVAQRKGSFMEEIIKVIFRVKPHDDYPDEDHYDAAANKSHNCTEQYPTCDGSIWSSMLGY